MVRTGDFEPMVAAFTHDGELRFEGIPVGPFVGWDAIARRYGTTTIVDASLARRRQP